MFLKKKKRKNKRKESPKHTKALEAVGTAGKREGIWGYVLMMKLLLGKSQFV